MMLLREYLETKERLTTFFTAYVEAACFTDEIEEIAYLDFVEMEKDCSEFLKLSRNFLDDEYIEHAGGDFWLTRNGHGTGFWDDDRGYSKSSGDQLTLLSQLFGNYNLDKGDE